MQTFLPYSDLEQSAAVLDMKRLGKQRVETLQIMHAIFDPTYGWQNHPAKKMWQDHPGYLYVYQVAICNEWTGRGYKDTCLEKTETLIFPHLDALHMEKPEWFGDERVHLSHRSNLLRKMPEHYGTLFEEGLSPEIEYFWPLEQLVLS